MYLGDEQANILQSYLLDRACGDQSIHDSVLHLSMDANPKAARHCKWWYKASGNQEI